MKSLRLAPALILLTLIHTSVTLQKKFDINEEDPRDWLERATEGFKPETFEDIDLIDDLEMFINAVKSMPEAFVFFYTREDSMTYALFPFYQTSVQIMKNDSKMRALAVDVLAHPEIAMHFGISSKATNVLYFYNGAPILFKHQTTKGNKKGVDVWMAENKSVADNLPEIKTIEDLDIFHNSNKLVMLVVDEISKEKLDWYRSLAVNFHDFQFCFMVRGKETSVFESTISEKYGIENLSGSKFFLFWGLLLFLFLCFFCRILGLYVYACVCNILKQIFFDIFRYFLRMI